MQQNHSSTNSYALAALAFAALWLAAVSRWLAADLVIPWDAQNHFYSMLRFLAARVHAGEMPLWNPYHFGGHPAAADPQSLLFTPTVSWLALASPAPSIHAFDVTVLAHLLAGGIAIIALFRRRGWHPAGALLAAMIYAFGGAASSRLQHTGIIVSYGLFPVCLAILENALARPALWRGLLFGLAAGVLALGRDQIAFYACLTLIACYAGALLKSREKLFWLKARLPMTLAMGLTGAALLVVPALLTMQFVADSNRPAFSYGYASASAMHPLHLVTLLFPDVFGNLARDIWYWGPSSVTIPAGPWNDASTSYLGIGTVPGVILLALGLAGLRLFTRDIRFFAVMLALAVLFSLGRYTPFFAAVFDYLPGANLYRRPNDLNFFINVAAAFACGYLLHDWLKDGPPPLLQGRARWLSLALIATAALGLALGLNGIQAFGAKASQLAYAQRELSYGLALAALTLAVLWLAPQRLRLAAAALLTLIASAELIWRNAASNLSGQPASGYKALTMLDGAQQAGFEILRKELADAQARGERPRVEFLGLEEGWQNAPMARGIDATGGYNALRISAYERATGIGENAVDLLLRKFPNTFRGYNSRLAQLLGLQYLVLVKPIGQMPPHLPRARAELIHASEKMFIYKLPKPAARAYIAQSVKPAALEEALNDAEIPEFDPAREALIEPADAAKLPPALLRPAAAAAGSARIVSASANKVVIEAESSASGLLVLHDSYYPGWTVTVNGAAKPVLRANLLFRGVETGAGKSLVEFRFRPFSPDNLAAALQFVLNKRRESR